MVKAERLGDLTDRELLERFSRLHDQSAFALVLRRHGPKVMGVCRRLLRDHHDAEDAFQAVFLVLARKAGTMQWRDSVAGWLFQVGYHLALRLRTRTARRPQSIPPHEIAADRGPDLELQSVLDAELQRLPEKYRAVVLLCLCEEKTRAEAAHLLGCTEGAVKIRLERARAILRKRLTRQGFGVQGGMLGGALAAGRAGVPAALTDATVAAARPFALGETTAVSAAAASLAEGVLKTMCLIRWKWAAFLVLALGILSTGVGLWGLPEKPAVAAPPGAVVAEQGLPKATRDAAAKEPVRAPRILLFAGGASREYQFLRAFLTREVERKRAELAIHLQGKTVGVVQDVPPERFLDHFPTRFASSDDKDDPKLRVDNLANYDVIIAFDPDWMQLTTDQVRSLHRWVAESGHELVFIAGPVNTFRLARPADEKKLRPLLDLLPVQLEDSRLAPDSDGGNPAPLVFSRAARGVEFLKLDDAHKGPTGGWEEFFHGTATGEAKPGDPVVHGFYSCYPVKKARPGAVVLATLGKADGQPYLVVGPQGKGRVVYIGSGETWRLRQYRQAYHERFWSQLVRHAAGNRTSP
jgi:RNA polymerase sigma factor (sigma-70 family)